MKKLIFPILIAIVFVVGVKLRIMAIEEEKAKEITTMASIWKENGKPVYTTTIQKGDFSEYFKVSLIVINKKRATIHTPFAFKDITNVMKRGIGVIDGKRYNLTQLSVDAKESEYSGFLKVLVKSDKNFPWPKGTKKIARIKYSTKKNKLTVPLTAIYKEKGKNFIYTVKNNSVVKSEVQIELQNHLDVVIKGDFRGGETLIISDQRDLVENEKVKAIQI